MRFRRQGRGGMDREGVQRDHELQGGRADFLHEVREDCEAGRCAGEHPGGAVNGILPGQMDISDFI